eukprot:6194963-Pleurochrysis_carterae.AAC.1
MLEDRQFAYCAQLMISRTLSSKLGKAREDQQLMSDYVLKLAKEAERAAQSRRFIEEKGVSDSTSHSKSSNASAAGEPQPSSQQGIDLTEFDIGLR